WRVRGYWVCVPVLVKEADAAGILQKVCQTRDVESLGVERKTIEERRTARGNQVGEIRVTARLNRGERAAIFRQREVPDLARRASAVIAQQEDRHFGFGTTEPNHVVVSLLFVGNRGIGLAGLVIRDRFLELIVVGLPVSDLSADVVYMIPI